MSSYLLTLDQGTTSSRAIIFDARGQAQGVGQQTYPQHYPDNGWVEHDPQDIWDTSLASMRQALKQSGLSAGDIACMGISNQRETTLVWERASGKPIHRAIVWQDRRTADYCNQLRDRGLEAQVQASTGLLLDPYFSASKIRWILDHVPGAQERAERGELAFGTVDSYLMWRATGGRRHVTDATNASRTLLFNLHTQAWDEELLALFQVPQAMLPEVLDSAAEFGELDAEWLGAPIPIRGVAGDQQAATIGQCCFSPGQAKITYGTGAFLLMNTGDQVIQSGKRLLSTVAYRLEGRPTYGLEGSIFMAGAIMQWLRDEMGLLQDVAESDALARDCRPDHGVYLVPAFTGLGAPYWDPKARAALLGLTRDSGRREVVQAALMSVCYQTRDLQAAMAADGAPWEVLRVDGGMSANDYLLENLAHVLDCQVDRPAVTETTALGVAWLAGLQSGLFDSLGHIAEHWQLQRSFKPSRDEAWRRAGYQGWQEAVARVRLNPSA